MPGSSPCPTDRLLNPPTKPIWFEVMTYFGIKPVQTSNDSRRQMSLYVSGERVWSNDIFLLSQKRKCLIEVISCNSTLFSEYVFGMWLNWISGQMIINDRNASQSCPKFVWMLEHLTLSKKRLRPISASVVLGSSPNLNFKLPPDFRVLSQPGGYCKSRIPNKNFDFKIFKYFPTDFVLHFPPVQELAVICPDGGIYE